ncbi:hypothetical protein NDA16_002782 [Ustilago loliicola]|nr:hypothetical protein NDA16_002782 [Ustilago loliicola]
MKYFAISMVSALALASLGSARPLPQSQATTQQQPQAQSSPSSQQQSSQNGSAGGYAGTGTAAQNNDYSQVAPGNQVMNGGGQSASLQGLAGNVLQGSNLGSFLRRRQSDGESSQQASAGGYAGTSTTYQNNDDSAVTPGNSVQVGGSQSASNEGTAGTVDQLSRIGLTANSKRMVPNDPSASAGFLDLLQGGQLPTKIVARDADSSNSNNAPVYLAYTDFGPVDDSSESHSLPHYMGIGPVVNPAPRPAL